MSSLPTYDPRSDIGDGDESNSDPPESLDAHSLPLAGNPTATPRKTMPMPPPPQHPPIAAEVPPSSMPSQSTGGSTPDFPISPLELPESLGTGIPLRTHTLNRAFPPPGPKFLVGPSEAPTVTSDANGVPRPPRVARVDIADLEKWVDGAIEKAEAVPEGRVFEEAVTKKAERGTEGNEEDGGDGMMSSDSNGQGVA